MPILANPARPPFTPGEAMMRLYLMRIISIAAMAGVTTMAPSAHAADTVTYEILTTSTIAALNVEYNDVSGRHALKKVPLPWRMNATVDNPRSNDAEVGADWRWLAKPWTWVTVRIYYRGSLLCEDTLDIGNAACYGSTIFKS
jgi:hypothetical protein